MLLVGGGVFAGDNVVFGEKPVIYGVLRSDCLAFGGFWAGGVLGVFAVCVGLFLC